MPRRPRPRPAAALITVASAAAQLSVGERTIRRYIATGKLPAYKIGPHLLRVSQADVDALAVPVPAAGAQS